MKKIPLQGLSDEEVRSRIAEGQINRDVGKLSKPVSTILRENLCTVFNLVNLLLAAAVIAVGSYKNTLFLGIVLSNLVIGIVQELRAKRTLDRLTLMNASRVRVLRGDTLTELPHDQIVRDDILRLGAGERVCADCVILEGACSADESFLTGESLAQERGVGDELMAGSFLLSGSVWVRAVRVGQMSRMAQITADAKRQKKAHSEIMSTLTAVVRVMAFLIIPVGALLLRQQLAIPGTTFADGVVATTAALVGMIPEGLMLLTSSVMAVGVIRLSRKRVLVQELTAIESLARVDVLCLDKTGTLTSGHMELACIEPLGNASEALCRDALSRVTTALEDENPTMLALRAAVPAAENLTVRRTVPFSSQYKWSGAAFDDETLVLGAPEWVYPSMDDGLRDHLHTLGSDGRVLLLARTQEPFPAKDGILPGGLTPLGLLVLRDELRTTASETLAYFRSQDVDIRVISGDSVETVAGVARRAGVPDADLAVDASTLSDDELRDAALTHKVFGRVTPMQKKLLIQSLQAAGHVVAMTGDGVNDVPALKVADCGVAMAAGADAARSTAKLVLLDSNFDALPPVVAEGRRSINNLQRSASLFLVKTIYATVLAAVFAIVPWQYPFVPIQMSLISGLTIGTPSFILALEPNHDRVRGRFFANVLSRASTGAVTVLVCIAWNYFAGLRGALPWEEIGTLCLLTSGTAGLFVVLHACLPFNPIRACLFACMTIGFYGAVTVLSSLFEVTALSPAGWGILAVGVALASVVFWTQIALRNRLIRRRS
ncbi:MAG: HAD family hydrolase [Ruminococcaceae bacterium]|nr:HAD family hydrolase [Oscillospiraceae bacterium]